MTLSFSRLSLALSAFAIVGFVAWTAVDADVPKAEDVAACNTEAHDAIRPGSSARGNAVPNTSDHSRAARARQNETSSEKTGRITRSADAQLDGMDGDGAKDPAYQAAFRGCMRRKGF
jgi:hypothetical protein